MTYVKIKIVAPYTNKNYKRVFHTIEIPIRTDDADVATFEVKRRFGWGVDILEVRQEEG